MLDISFVSQKLFNRLIYRPWLRWKLAKVGDNFRLGHSSVLLNPGRFSIGDHFFSGPFSYFGTNNNNPVYIGDYVMFGPGCTIQGGNHDVQYPGFMRLNQRIDDSNGIVKIGHGVWIGAQSTIVSGADIGEGSVVGAMSLVNKPIPPYVVAGGVPVRIIKPRFSSLIQLNSTLQATNSKLNLEDIVRAHSALGIRYFDQDVIFSSEYDA